MKGHLAVWQWSRNWTQKSLHLEFFPNINFSLPFANAEFMIFLPEAGELAAEYDIKGERRSL
jgi:hypothetical protein